MIGRFICWITRKHKRGKRVGRNDFVGAFTYQCPRCGLRWERKVGTKKVLA